jgi:hypothetical protein
MQKGSTRLSTQYSVSIKEGSCAELICRVFFFFCFAG